MGRGKLTLTLVTLGTSVILLAACAAPSVVPTPEQATPTPTPTLTPPADTVPPPAITGLVAFDAYDGRVNLSWDKNAAEDFDHYNIYIGKSEIVDVTDMTLTETIGDIATINYQVSGLEDGTDYYLAVSGLERRR